MRYTTPVWNLAQFKEPALAIVSMDVAQNWQVFVEGWPNWYDCCVDCYGVQYWDWGHDYTCAADIDGDGVPGRMTPNGPQAGFVATRHQNGALYFFIWTGMLSGIVLGGLTRACGLLSTKQASR
jgi:hypothetical protein